MGKAMQVLRIEEQVRLVLPTHADWGWGHAHVARTSFPVRTVCGCRIRNWWFWHPDTQPVATLRDEWGAQGGRISDLVHFQGMHLGGLVNMHPVVCGNCHHLVVYGKRPRWAPRDSDAYYDYYDTWSDVTGAEALALHGFAPELAEAHS